MTINVVVTAGFGNGTFNGTIAELVTRGYTIGEVVIVPAGDAIIMRPSIMDRGMKPTLGNRTMRVNRG